MANKNQTVAVETEQQLNKTDAFKNGEVYCFAYDNAGNNNGEWPGQKMTDNGTTYTLDVEDSFTNLKFVGCYGEYADGSAATIECIIVFPVIFSIFF